MKMENRNDTGNNKTTVQLEFIFRYKFPYIHFTMLLFFVFMKTYQKLMTIQAMTIVGMEAETITTLKMKVVGMEVETMTTLKMKVVKEVEITLSGAAMKMKKVEYQINEY